MLPFLTKYAERLRYNQFITGVVPALAEGSSGYLKEQLRGAGGVSYVEVTIYIDVFWMRTFEMELFVCMFVNQWMKQMRPTWRLIWMTAAAVSAEVLAFVIFGYGSVYAVTSLLSRMLLLLAVFRPKSWGIFLRLFLWSVTATIAAGGVFTACMDHFLKRYWFSAGVIFCALLVIISLILEERRMMHDCHLYRVKLYDHENVVEVTGLHDTGNRLRDPYVQEPVHILALSEAQKLQKEPKSSRLIPFTTIGAPDGMLEVWTIDGMEWPGGRQEQVVIGVAPDVIFAGKDYRMILSADWRGES